MPHVRRTLLRSRARRRLSVAAAAALVVALASGLLATPLGAVAAPTPTDTPTASPTPAENAAPSPSPSPTSAPSATPTSTPSPAPAPTDPATEAPVEPSAPPSEPEVPVSEEPPTDADDAGSASRSTPEARADIGILAAGVPEAPTQVWIETFEQSLGTAPVAVTAYPPSATARFTAATYWANLGDCTGVLLSYTAIFPSNNTVCATLLGPSALPQRQTQRLADVLGQVNVGIAGGATTPTNASTAATRSNHALTESGVALSVNPGNLVVLESAAAVATSATASRYYVLQTDMAGDECDSTNAQLDAFLIVGGTARQLTNTAAWNACGQTNNLYTSPTVGGVAWATNVRASRLTADTALLLTAAEANSARVRVTNRTSASVGNVFAIDNTRLLDATPRLDTAFSPTTVAGGAPTTLTYTITNTSDLVAKSDWSFTNTLPTGLAVAATPAVGGTCTNAAGTATTFAVTATAGASTVSAVGGDLTAGMVSCTVTVNVVSAAPTPATYSIAPAGFSTPLIVANTSTLTVTQASTLTIRKNITARNVATDQFTLSVRSGTTVLGSATTTGTATGVQPVQAGPVIVQPNTTYTIHETAASGAGLAYASSYECLRGTTVVAAGSNPSGSITMPSDQGAEIVCTFTNTPQTPRLACNVNQFYAVNQIGALTQVDIVTGTMTTVGSWTAANANGLGIGTNGTIAYALERSASDAGNIASMLKWTPAGGFQTIANSAYTTVAGGTTITGSIVAGTVDLTNNRYLFGKFSGGSFYIWSYTEATNAYAFLGSFPTGSGPNGNGDMAFDSRGNLYVAGSATVNNVNSAAIYTVPASALVAPGGAVLPVNTSNTRALSGTDASPVLGSINGIAFSPRGTAYLSSSTGTYEFDPTTWTRVTGSSSVPPTGTTTDLSACSSPSTVTVLKNVVGRAATPDQFDITLANGASTVATATTTGAATGRQSAQIGPYPAPLGTTLTISEAMATGSTSVIGVYTTVYECWLDGVRIATGTAASGAVTMPNQLNANVVCTFFNSPRPASSVTLTKQVVGPTGTTTPGAGWTLGTTATATVGTATVLPSEAPQQQTDAAGTAVWSVLFGSTASRATLTISEVQQAGFAFVGGSCTVNGAATPVTFSTSGNVVSATIAGVASASAVACTLTNRSVAALTLVKRVSFGSALPSDWTLSATGPTGALPGPTGRSGTPAVSAISVTPGVAYRLAEAGGSLLYPQVGAWVCATASGTPVTVTAAGDVTLTAGSSVTCTVTNATATITLVKQVQNPQTGFQAPNWTITATPGAFAGGTLPTVTRVGAEYVAGGNAASTAEVRPSQTYTLTEDLTTPGTRRAYQTLRIERLDGTTWTPISTTSSATITTPAVGQNAVYRFVNAPVPALVLPLAGGMGTDAFLIGGGAVLALALAAGVLYSRRRARREPM